MSLSLAMNWLSKSHLSGQIALSLMLMLAAGQGRCLDALSTVLEYPKRTRVRQLPSLAPSRLSGMLLSLWHGIHLSEISSFITLLMANRAKLQG
jgi:hypothetical protein